MPCTTFLVGKKASYDGSTIISRTDDGFYDEKKVIVVNPDKQPKIYKSKISHVEIPLPDYPIGYTCAPSIDDRHGIWPAQGINKENVGMTATETTTSNALVLAADPYVCYKKATSKKEKDTPGGIGEEDIVTLVLPYIHSARDGVKRLGTLLEKYGTYESNGIAFHDQDEIWWFESIGGHHWMAKRVPDDCYVIMPNQFGLDHFDFNDAFSNQDENMCSSDLKDFMEKYHLDCNNDNNFNPRKVFGSHSVQDHCYNTPRAWYMARYFNPNTYRFDGPDADFTPESDDIPWSLVPEKKITIEEVKFILSSHYQGTDYDPYSNKENPNKGKYRSIGIPRTGIAPINQIRGYLPKEIQSIEWICFGCNAFNAPLPVYINVDKMPDYVSNTTLDVNTNSFYWCSRLIGALIDPIYSSGIQLIERYQYQMEIMGHKLINEYDQKIRETCDFSLLSKMNEKMADEAKKITQDTLNKVILEASKAMKGNYNRKDN